MVVKYPDLNSSLLDIPGYVFSKDIEGHYLGCNDPFGEVSQQSNRREVIGKTDLLLPWRSNEEMFRAYDQRA